MIMRCSVHVLLLAGGLCGLAHGQELPSWKFTAGDKADYRLTIESRLDIGSAGNLKQLASVKQQVDYSWEVNTVAEDGSATLTVAVQDYQLQVIGPGGKEVAFDTSATDEPQGFAAMLLPVGKQLSQAQVQLKMTPAGEVTVLNLPQNLDQAVKAVPGGEVYSVDGGAASFSHLARLGGWGFPLVSDESGVWQESVPAAPDQKSPLAITFQYQSVEPGENGITQIDKKMLLEPGPDSQVQIVEQESGGEISFDSNLGRPILAVHSVRAVLQTAAQPTEQTVLKLEAKYQQLTEESAPQ